MELSDLDSQKGCERRATTVSGLPARERYTRQIEFLLSCIGFAVGLGNVWRFPYLCYKNGGGAFFIPYLIFLFGGGIPIFFMEVALGQFTSEGGISAWNICPIFQGVGYGGMVILMLLNVYYIVVLAWTLVYLGYSFTSTVPWATCGNEWNTKMCYSVFDQNLNATVDLPNNQTRVDSVVEFWENKILKISSGIEELGAVRLELAFALLGAWVICYFCVWKGIKSIGKVVYFTATFPYLMLTILLVRGVTLPGAVQGIVFYLYPDFSKLAEAQVWLDAGTQILFSYAVGQACLTALGSYNKYNHNCYRDCLMMALINSGTSFLAGFVIFSVLGNMSWELGIPVSEVAEKGPGLVFVAYPKAISQMPAAPLWAILFFLMVLTLGLGSQLIQVGAVVTGIVDLFPRFFRRKYFREGLTAYICLITFLAGLPLVTEGGMYLVQLFDFYSASGFTLLWVVFFECVALSWVYGVNRFFDNVNDMLGFKVNIWMKICWLAVTPLICFIIFLFCIISYSPVTYNKTYHYPLWAEIFGWFLSLSSMSCVPGWFAYKLLTEQGPLKKRWQNATLPVIRNNQAQVS